MKASLPETRCVGICSVCGVTGSKERTAAGSTLDRPPASSPRWSFASRQLSLARGRGVCVAESGAVLLLRNQSGTSPALSCLALSPEPVTRAFSPSLNGSCSVCVFRREAALFTFRGKGLRFFERWWLMTLSAVTMRGGPSSRPSAPEPMQSPTEQTHTLASGSRSGKVTEAGRSGGGSPRHLGGRCAGNRALRSLFRASLGFPCLSADITELLGLTRLSLLPYP